MGDDQLVFQGMFPADQFGNRYLVAMCFELQAAQNIGQMAAKFPGMQRVALQFDQGLVSFGQCPGFVATQGSSYLCLTAGHQHDAGGLPLQGKMQGIIRGRVAGMQRRDHFRTLGELR